MVALVQEQFDAEADADRRRELAGTPPSLGQWAPASGWTAGP